VAAIGCAGRLPAVRYLGDGDNRYYRAQATEIDYPLVADNPPEELTASSPPRTIRDTERSEIRDLTLAEAIHIALQNSEVIRRYGEFLSPGNSLFQSPNFVPSVYDPAIQESGVLFGGRGVEAALADFDASLTSSLVWGRNETIRNLPGAPTSVAETAEYQTSLQKIFARRRPFGRSEHRLPVFEHAGRPVRFRLHRQHRPVLPAAVAGRSRNAIHADRGTDRAQLRRHHRCVKGRADRADQQRHLAGRL
jgi:hypothetical protein